MKKIIITNLVLIFLLVPFIANGADSPYTKWSNGFSDDPNFFPIGVWLQSPSNAPEYQDIGINVYIGLWAGPTEAQLSVLKQHGMHVIASQNNVGLNSQNNDIILGWMLQDEPDNAQSDGSGGYGPPVDPLVIQQQYNTYKSNDPTRPVYINFGMGLAYEAWYGRGTRTGHLEDYPEYIKGADIVSFDIYPVVAESGSASFVNDKLEYVAIGVERLAEWSAGEKVVWNILETTHINSSDDRATPEEIRTEVWMSLVHGSMGISYFVHEWQPSFREDGIFRYPEIVDAVRNINAQIKELAPVLNSPTVENGVEVQSDVLVKHMVKHYNNEVYLFAVVMRDNSTTAQFSIAGLSGTDTAEVLGESREIQVVDGQFQDDFEGYGVHLYKVIPSNGVEPNPDPEPQPDPEEEDVQAEDDAGGIIPDQTLLRISNNIIKSDGNSVVTINCDVKDAGTLTVKIYDAKGREIITLWNKHEEPGTVPITWTGLDASGGKVGSGIYLIHMECGGYKETKKIAVIK